LFILSIKIISTIDNYLERYVIFIDDYSDLMSPANRKQALEFLHNFIKTAQQQNIQVC